MMPFTRLEFEKLWTSDKDFPTYEDSESQVREDLQYHPDAIRAYLNEVLLAALEDPEAARNLGAAAGTVRGTLQDVLNDFLSRFGTLDRAVVDLAAGDAPEAVKAAAVVFTQEGWTGSGGQYTLRLAQSAHKRQGDGFGYHLQSAVGGGYQGGTWDAAGTSVIYEESSGDMVLTAGEPYSGRIVFFGV